MGNAPKAEHTDRVTKKLLKVETQLAEARGEIQQLGLSVMNLRQMYEGITGEKQGIQMQLANVQQLLTAVIINARGQKLVIKAKVLESLSDYAGIDTKADDNGNLTLMALTIAEVAAMEEDIDGDGE